MRLLSVEARRSTTLVQLTKQAVNAMLATGVACRAVATAAKGMRATHVWGTRALTERPVKIIRVAGETLRSDRRVAMSKNGLLVEKDGSLLAAVERWRSEHYSLAGIVSDFLEDRMWQLRCRSLER